MYILIDLRRYTTEIDDGVRLGCAERALRVVTRMLWMRSD